MRLFSLNQNILIKYDSREWVVEQLDLVIIIQLIEELDSLDINLIKTIFVWKIISALSNF